MNLAVIGLGKLGLPLACLHAESSRVYGIDVNKFAVGQINVGTSPVEEPGLEALLHRVQRTGFFSAHHDYSVIKDCDASLIIVPTPSRGNGSFDADYVYQACRGIGNVIKNKTDRHVVVVCSTVMPGTCATHVRQILEETTGKKVGGEELGLIYSPEFIALGSVIDDMRFPDMILIGESDPESGKLYEHIARRIANVAPVMPHAFHMSLTSAEIAKISVNSYVTMKISFANGLAELCEQYVGADALQIAKAIGADRRIGRAYLTPGTAFGGPCFPRDNRALAFAGEQVGVALPLTEATDEVNRRQVQTMLNRIKPYNRQHIGILGLSYKPGTAVTEESYGVQLAQALHQAGYTVTVYDPLVKHENNRTLLPTEVKWAALPTEMVDNQSLTIICTPDPKFETLFPITFAVPDKQQALVYDCWGVIETGPWDNTNVIRLGRP